MDRIPPEIKSQIIRHAFARKKRVPIAQYATVSREWQEHIESIAFKSIYLDPGRLAKAKEIITPSRQSFVRKIEFSAWSSDGPSSSTSSEQNDANGEDSPEQQANANSEHFTEQLSSLLNYLNGWTVAHGKVELLIPVQKNERSTIINLQADIYRQLPKIHFITKFTLKSFTHREVLQLSPKTCCEISSLFPNVRSIDWWLTSALENDAARIQSRVEFAAALALVPASVRTFCLMYLSSTDRNDENTRLTPLFSSGEPDPLSVALRQLSTQLEFVYLSLAIDSELFFGTGINPEETHWPRMRDVIVTGGIRTPGGDSFFHTDSESGRTVPTQETINRYYLASGRAAAVMRNLRTILILWHEPQFSPGSLLYTTREETTEANLVVYGTYPDGAELELDQYVEKTWLVAAKERFGAGGSCTLNSIAHCADGIPRLATTHFSGNG
ncbi:hypothetical protein PG996_006931 [Apiospora saccharicola]|uniref:DUF6546 domain-containing protein n=1 Tax=Apiospora saccharicola TaxID=335842 RepID=A0ABR1VCR9_9PEZI